MSLTPRNPTSRESSLSAANRAWPTRKRGHSIRPPALIAAAWLAIGLTTARVDAQMGCPTERVNVGAERAEATSMSNWPPSISADGMMVAFSSTAPNLVPGDTNGAWDIFVRNMETETTVRVSVGVDPATGARIQSDWSSTHPHMTPDGRFVSFYSDATNLVTPLITYPGQIYVHDRDADVDLIFDEIGPGETSTVLVSVDDDGVEAFEGVNVESMITPDAQFVVFASAANRTFDAWDRHDVASVRPAHGLPDGLQLHSICF